MDKNKKQDQINIKELIVEQLGLELEDLNESDSLQNDLHMRATDLADLMENLERNGVDTNKIDLTQIETVEDLIDAIGEEEYTVS